MVTFEDGDGDGDGDGACDTATTDPDAGTTRKKVVLDESGGQETCSARYHTLQQEVRARSAFPGRSF